jgi:hypothetical protein
MESLVDLVKAAQSLLDSGFDVQQFLTWKSLAFFSLLGLLGPLHYYTKTFCRVTQAPDPVHLMAGEGVLVAINQGLSQISDSLPTERQPEFQEGKSTSPFLKRCIGKSCSLRLAQEAFRAND